MSITDPTTIALQAAITKGIENYHFDNWSYFRQAITLLDSEDKAVNRLVFDKELYTLPILHSLILRNVPSELFERVLELGPDLDRKATQRNSAAEDRYYQFTPLMMALSQGNLDLAWLLCDKGCSREGALALAVNLDRDEDEPVRTQFLLSRGVPLSSLPDDLLRGANLRGLRVSEDLRGRDLSGANLINSDLSASSFDDTTSLVGAVRSPDSAFPDGFTFRDPTRRIQKAVPHPVLGTERYVSNRELERIFTHLTHKSELPSLVSAEAHTLRQGSGSISDAIRYIAAFDDAITNFPHGTGLPLTSLLPRILFAYPDIAIRHFLEHLERRMDRCLPEPAGHHQNMAELLALCAHPRDPGLQSPLVTSLGTAITSVDRWIGRKNDKLLFTNELLALFGNVGLLSHSFLSLKYATQRHRSQGDGGKDVVRPALIESFGGRFVPDNESGFGHRYVFSPGTISFSTSAPDLLGKSEGSRKFRSDIFIELRRGYYLVSDPEHGTLIIRNSSPDFGRDKLPDVAFWSPHGVDHGFTEADILAFNLPTLQIGDFRHITDPALYRKSENAVSHIRVLEQNLIDLIDHFHRWTFDTSETAWQHSSDDGEPVLVGGHLSEGFGAVVGFLESRKRTNLERSWAGQPLSPLPALAVMPQHLPWWAPYPLTPALDDQPSQYQIPVTLPVIETLRRLQRGELGPETPDETGVINLLQRALDKRAVLALVDPYPEDW